VRKPEPTVQLARMISICLLGVIFGACGSDRVNPTMPEEFVPDEEPIQETSVRSEDVNVLGSVNIERNRPVTSSSDTIIYTPTEEPRKVPMLADCTTPYQVTATTNPFLAGMPGNSAIAYPNSTDRAPRNSPLQMMPNDAQCLEAGRALYFKVDGRIAFGNMPGQESNADGQSLKVVQHTLGNVNRIAMVAAPINSLIGIFLDATPTDQRTTTAPGLDFRGEDKRNFKMIAPAIGQIFFIGDGKDSSGAMQAFVVPPGATRLYVAIMDEYEWNNNVGRLTVTASWLKP